MHCLTENVWAGAVYYVYESNSIAALWRLLHCTVIAEIKFRRK